MVIQDDHLFRFNQEIAKRLDTLPFQDWIGLVNAGLIEKDHHFAIPVQKPPELMKCQQSNKTDRRHEQLISISHFELLQVVEPMQKPGSDQISAY